VGRSSSSGGSASTLDPRADIRSLTVRASGGRFCVSFETARRITGELGAGFQVRNPGPDRPGRPFFLQGFDVELRPDGTARVTSGLDDSRHTIAVPARVGVSGSRLSLELDQPSFARGRPSPMSQGSAPLEQFSFLAFLSTKAGMTAALRDYLGPARGAPSTFDYPSGRAVRPY
jgi:hypothetical protein